MLQNIGSNPAIASVVSKAGKHDNMLRRILLNNRGGELAGVLHELRLRCARTLNDVLKTNDFLNAQHRFH